MLVRNLFHRVSTALSDADPQFRRWTELELVQAANDGQIAIATYLPSAGGRVDVIKLSPGSRQFVGTIPAASVIPGDGQLPDDIRVIQVQDIVRNMGADGASPGAAVSVVSREDLDAVSRIWHTTRPARAIEHYAVDPRMPGYIYVYPPVRTEGLWVEAMLLACPREIPAPAAPGDYAVNGQSSARIGVPDQHATDLLNYILARCWMKDAEEAANQSLAQTYAAMFVNSINAQAQVQTGHNPNLKNLPMTPSIPAAAA